MQIFAMSLLIQAAILFVTPAPPSTQTQQEVEAVKFSWRKLPGRSAPSGKKAQEARVSQINASLSTERAKDPRDQDRGAINQSQQERLQLQRNQVTIDSFNRTNMAYEYKFKFKNRGNKEVAMLIWQCLFIDAGSGKELGRLRFGSKARLRPGKEVGLTAYSDSSPPMVVNAGAAAKDGKVWKELVIVESIEFSDGSKWDRTSP